MSVLQQFKCPCCDGAIEFDSTVQKMKCPYCGTEFEMEAIQPQEEQTDEMTWDTAAGSEWQPGETEGLRVYTCNTCGGEIVADDTAGATECPYCGNPVVMTGQFAGDLKPDLVIPFKVDKKSAIGKLQELYKGKLLLPRVFKDQNHISDIYNAYLEGFVEYTWFRDGVRFMEGGSMYITESHRGHTFYLAADLYSDAELTDFVGTIYSQSFTVPEAEKPTIPEITTEQLPNAVVGQEYYLRLECTDPDVSYSLFRSSLPDGLYLTQHGEIEGTPTKEGMWYVVIMVTPEAGEDYANTAEFEFYVVEDGPDYTIEVIELPKKTTYYQGEKLDMTGLKVRIWTPDGYIDSKDGKYLTYYEGTLDNLGERKINLKYEDAKTPIYVTVIEAPMPTETQPPATTVPPTTEAPPETTVPPTIEAPPETTVPPTTEAPPETTVPPTTEAPPETTVPPTTETPTEPTQAPTEPAEPQGKGDDGVTIAAIAGGSAVAVAGIGAYVFLKVKGLIK